jgi:hypothetical protein
LDLSGNKSFLMKDKLENIDDKESEQQLIHHDGKN